MNAPSSTITAASLAGMGMTLMWELVMQFNLIGPVRPALIAGSVTLVAAIVGYFKKENVLTK
jgi:predicted membrane-bound spermidine synthase